MRSDLGVVVVAVLAAACGIVEADRSPDARYSADAVDVDADGADGAGAPDAATDAPVDAGEFVRRVCFCVTTGQTMPGYCVRGTCASPATSCDDECGGAGYPTSCAPGC
jgi:hypothetical protein